jgi:hypothetical protein
MTDGAERADERELDELFARVRAVRPEPGARERVLARSERALQAPRPTATRKLAFGALALGFVSAAAASALWLAPPSAPAHAPPDQGKRDERKRAARKAPRATTPAATPPAYAPVQPAPPEPIEPVGSGEKADRSARARPTSEAADPSQLALQVDAYRQALALRGRNDARAVQLWRAMNQRWPRGPLRHEIDLGVIDALVRLGRSAEARSEARAFVERHPRSSKADALRGMLGDTGAANDAAHENAADRSDGQ